MQDKKLLRQAERELMPDVIYAIVDEDGDRTGSYADTVDGIGMCWYESLEQVAEDYEDVDAMPMLEVTSKQLECIREGIGPCSGCNWPILDLDNTDGICDDCKELQ